MRGRRRRRQDDEEMWEEEGERRRKRSIMRTLVWRGGWREGVERNPKEDCFKHSTSQEVGTVKGEIV